MRFLANDAACQSIGLLPLLLSMLMQTSIAETTKVRTIPTPLSGHAIVAKCDSAGTIHLAFDSSDGPMYAVSNDEGKTFGKPMSLVDVASRKPGLEFIVWDLAVSANGHVHLALGNNAWKLKLPKEEWGYFYTHHLPGDEGFSVLKNINHTPSEGFSIAASENGTVTAVWMADKLFANVSRDAGATFEPTVEINSALNPCNCCTTSSAYGSDGRLAILYREETDNQRDMYLAQWDQKTNMVTKNRISKTSWKTDQCPMTYYSMTPVKQGFLAAWPTKGQIYFARIDASSSAIPPEEVKTPGSNGMRTGVIALETLDGGALIAWKKEGNLGWQLYDKKGRSIGPTGSAKSEGNGAAGIINKQGEVLLFR